MDYEVVIEIPSDGPTFPTEFGLKSFGLVIDQQGLDALLAKLEGTKAPAK